MLQNKFSLSLNYPVLFLGLFLWSGIFGGMWFASRGMLLFGTLIWPVIVVGIRLLILFLLGSIVLWDTSQITWLIFSAIMSGIVTQFILSAIANCIYFRWAARKVKNGKNINLSQYKTKNIVIAFITLFLICVLLRLAGYSGKPPALFWA